MSEMAVRVKRRRGSGRQDAASTSGNHTAGGGEGGVSAPQSSAKRSNAQTIAPCPAVFYLSGWCSIARSATPVEDYVQYGYFPRSIFISP